MYCGLYLPVCITYFTCLPSLTDDILFVYMNKKAVQMARIVNNNVLFYDCLFQLYPINMQRLDKQIGSSLMR